MKYIEIVDKDKKVIATINFTDEGYVINSEYGGPLFIEMIEEVLKNLKKESEIN